MELPCFIHGNNLFLEQEKNKFLAALYEKNFQIAGQIYIDIVKYVESQSELSENNQNC